MDVKEKLKRAIDEIEDRVKFKLNDTLKIAWISTEKITIGISYEIVNKLSETELLRYVVKSLEHCKINEITCRGKLWGL